MSKLRMCITVFETVKTQYYNKSGKLVSYMRSARLDKHDSVETIIYKLQVLAEKYLLNRFFFVAMIKCTRKSFSKQHRTTHFG